MSIPPIFVVGRHRSGTTWLVNILAAHPDVYTPQDPAHMGQHESAFFSHVVPYCNWGRRRADLHAIQAIFESSDFYELAGRPDTPPIAECGYAEYFRAMMDAAARKQGAKCWIEKTPMHTLVLRDLLDFYPDAMFVCVRRRPIDVVRSAMANATRTPGFSDWFESAFWTGLYERITDRHVRRLRFVTYDDLQCDYHATVARILEEAGLDATEIPESGFAPNSSFRSGRPPPGAWQRRMAALGLAVARIMPTRLAEGSARLYLRARRKSLPGWFWRITKKEDA